MASVGLYLHEDRRRPTRFRKDAPPAIPPPIASEKSTLGRSCTARSNDDAAPSESSSSLVKHRSQKRPDFMFASSCYEK